MKAFKKLGYLTIYMIISIIFNLVFAFALKWGWNVSMPYLFGLPSITWVQSFGLMLVAMIVIPHKVLDFTGEKDEI